MKLLLLLFYEVILIKCRRILGNLYTLQENMDILSVIGIVGILFRNVFMQ